MAATKKIAIPKLELERFCLDIEGMSPLITHCWSEKAKKALRDAYMSKATTGKARKNPTGEFLETLYWLDEDGNRVRFPKELDNATDDTPVEEIEAVMAKHRFGFPASAFKDSAIDGAFQQGLIPKKTTANGAFFVLGEFAIIEGEISMREDMVVIGGMSKSPDLRYCAQFKNWRTTLLIEYNPKSITVEQIASYFNQGGSSVGVGEWRPQRHGQFGRYKVAEQ